MVISNTARHRQQRHLWSCKWNAALLFVIQWLLVALVKGGKFTVTTISSDVKKQCAADPNGKT